MDGWTEYLNPTRCPWPCGFVTIASVIIIVGAIKYVVQLVFKSRQKAGGSNQ